MLRRNQRLPSYDSETRLEFAFFLKMENFSLGLWQCPRQEDQHTNGPAKDSWEHRRSHGEAKIGRGVKPHLWAARVQQQEQGEMQPAEIASSESFLHFLSLLLGLSLPSSHPISCSTAFEYRNYRFLCSPLPISFLKRLNFWSEGRKEKLLGKKSFNLPLAEFKMRHARSWGHFPSRGLHYTNAKGWTGVVPCFSGEAAKEMINNDWLKPIKRR